MSAKGESECEATSLDFVILDYCIILKTNLNIENVLEKQEIWKNKQSRQTHTNKFPLFLKPLSGWKWQWVSGLLSGLVLFLQICSADSGVAVLRRVIGSCSVTQSVENQAEPVSQSLRPLSQRDHRQPQWKWMSHAVLWPLHLICCKHHLIEYQGQTMTVQEPLFQPLTILSWGVKMHFFFPLRYLRWIPETRQTSLQKNGNVTTCYISWCQCINPTQVGGENDMSCVSVHDTCIYLRAHSFLLHFVFLFVQLLLIQRDSVQLHWQSHLWPARLKYYYCIFFPNWACSAWYTWQMLHPSEPSHLHSLWSKFWPSACDKKWQLKSLEGFEFTVFCTVRLTCSCQSKLWPSAAVSLWEGSRTHNATGTRPLYLTLWNVRATKTCISSPVDLWLMVKWCFRSWFGRLWTHNPLGTWQCAWPPSQQKSSEPAEVHTLAWTLTCGVWSSDVTIFCTDDTEHRGKVFIVQYKFHILKC